MSFKAAAAALLVVTCAMTLPASAHGPDPTPAPPPAASSSPPAPAPPSTFWMHQEFGPLVGTNLSSSAHPLLGVQVRLAGIFVRHSAARWAYGFALDSTFAGIARSDSLLSMIGLGLAGVARRGGDRWSPELALGARAAALMLEDDQGISIYKDFVVSPFGVAALERRLTARLSARAALELGVAAVTPDARLNSLAGSDGRQLVGGAWALFLMGLSVRYF